MSDLPYRPCVGVALVNLEGDAFIGHRKRKRSSEVLDPRSWQMPQGGIDSGEQPLEAARRELWEETNVRSIELIAELPRWLKYDLPEGARGRWSGRYRGQTQKWFLFRFVGPEKEIDVRRPAGGAHDPAVVRRGIMAFGGHAGEKCVDALHVPQSDLKVQHPASISIVLRAPRRMRPRTQHVP